MNQLLELAIAAHGGQGRWKHLRSLRANLSVTGALWASRGVAGWLKEIEIEAQLHEQKVITSLPSKKKRFIFQPDLVVIESESGQERSAHVNPRKAFEGLSATTPFEDVHVAYFNSYAIWNYLTAPFQFAAVGYHGEELDEWKEGGALWHPLKVTFPEGIATHTREQVAYFGPDGLLRRLEYAVDVLGGAKGLNYATEYREISGIMLPMKRRVYPADAQHRKVEEPVLVAIDFHEMTVQ
ncbi:MAG TPA: hypothetical protein VGM54_16635 [Chthoniobacter sp.]|jgi:hypothetical protein